MKKSPNNGFPTKQLKDAWKSFSECGSIEFYCEYAKAKKAYEEQGKPKDNLADDENVQCA